MLFLDVFAQLFNFKPRSLLAVKAAAPSVLGRRVVELIDHACGLVDLVEDLPPDLYRWGSEQVEKLSGGDRKSVV